MKTMILHLLVILYIFPRCICRGSTICTELGGEVPIPIFNSPYTILPNGSLCCPFFVGDYCDTDEKSIADKCGDRGLVYEPCFFCKTCAKIAGESCGGNQAQHGRCGEGLECVISNENDTSGICYKKATKHIGEACGGSYGIDGRCLPGLKCSVTEQRILDGDKTLGVCFNGTTAPGACYKKCPPRTNDSVVCGNDGRWYDNKCHVRQQNCIVPKDRHPQKVKPLKENWICINACGDVTDAENWTRQPPQARVASYSFGVVNGSNATVVCDEGYRLLNQRENMTLQCNEGRWKNVVNEELRENWTVVCYKLSDASISPE